MKDTKEAIETLSNRIDYLWKEDFIDQFTYARLHKDLNELETVLVGGSKE